MKNRCRLLCILFGMFVLAVVPVRAAVPLRDSVVVLMGTVGRPAYYLPFYAAFDVPENTVQLRVRQSFHAPGSESCNLDLGVFDERGHEGPGAGFRGWSGGARREFTVGLREATPGYLAGPIRPGRWSVVQMLTSKTDVQWQLEITLTLVPVTKGAPVIRPAKESLNRRPGLYRLAPHVHTNHSDGALSPAEVVALARTSGLDGIISTEHNTTSALRCWGEVQQPDLLVVNGLEVTYPEGHWNAVGIPPGLWVDFRTRSTDTTAFRQDVQRVQAAGALAIANHPYDIPFMHDVTSMDGVEVWNSTWDDRDERALRLWNSLLRRGYRLTALASTDFHRGKSIASPHVQVRCEALSAPAVIEAVRAGALWMLDDPATELLFEVRNADGAASGPECQEVLFRCNRSGSLRLIDQCGVFLETEVEADELRKIAPGRGSKWVRAELRNERNGMIALTNPVYLNVK